jgi:hypothetical protein
MKSYKQFISESVTISGNASVGTIIVNGTESQPNPVGEQFCADFMWEGNLYRIELVSDSNVLPSREKLAEQIQNEYPGAIVHNIYPLIPTQNSYKVSEVKRYHPSKLEWI